MRVVPCTGQPELLYVLLTEEDAKELREALRKRKSPLAQELRRALKRWLS